MKNNSGVVTESKICISFSPFEEVIKDPRQSVFIIWLCTIIWVLVFMANILCDCYHQNNSTIMEFVCIYPVAIVIQVSLGTAMAIVYDFSKGKTVVNIGSMIVLVLPYIAYVASIVQLRKIRGNGNKQQWPEMKNISRWLHPCTYYWQSYSMSFW